MTLTLRKETGEIKIPETAYACEELKLFTIPEEPAILYKPAIIQGSYNE